MRASARRDSDRHAFSRRGAIRRLVASLLAAVLLAGLGHARAAPMELYRAELVKRQDAYHLVGRFDLNLNPALLDALQRGVSLTFIQQFEADRPRDYWFADDVVVLKRSLRLAYHALLRYYQLEIDGRTQSYAQLDDAVRAAGEFHDWRVIEAKRLDRQHTYRARVRMSLDTAQLPKPLQINATVSDRWALDSGWRNWPFRP
jgi:hypothetical protein